MKKSLAVIFFFLSLFSQAQEYSNFFDMADIFFKTYVENGKVKYAEIKQNPKQLDDLLFEAKKLNIPLDNPKEYKSFWINAYNLASIKGVVNNLPINSPLEVEGFFDKQPFSIAQQSLTLDEIEHKKLFGNFPDEARFHFVLVCAAKGCPPLMSVAYRPEILENQLQQQTIKALNNPDFVKVENDQVLFSEIMKWYLDDFTNTGSSLIEYVNKFRKNIIPLNTRTAYYPYNWELNEF